MPFSAEWGGYLLVPRTSRYRVVLLADDRASLEVDRQLIEGDRTAPIRGSVELSRGLHPVRLRYEDDGGEQALEVLWAEGTGTPAGIPPLFLVPDLRPYAEMRARRMLGWMMPAIAVFWSGVLLIAAAVAVHRLVRTLSNAGERSLVPAILLLVAAVAFTYAIWWGMPDYGGWATDEITPGYVADAVSRRFAGGWATSYPPLHYAVLAAFTIPFYLMGALGVLDLQHLHVITAMFVVQRLVSVVMAVGTLGLVYVIGSTISRRAGVFAAATLAVVLPFSYYAKLANLDVPYVFWFTLSMVFYLRMHRTGATADFLFFVLAGASAIATKDQAYAFYLLPAIVIVVSAFRNRSANAVARAAPALPVLAAMIALAIVSLLAFDNVLFNFGGFLEHVRIITGPASQHFRMYDGTPVSYVAMVRDSVVQLGEAMSWPLFCSAAVATVMAWRAQVPAVRHLLLPLLSYYVTFIAVVGYQYDRFFLGPAVILAVAHGWWLDRWLEPHAAALALRRATALCAFAYALSRIVALDLLMARESRYVVEEWILTNVRDSAQLAGAGRYLPRGSRLFWKPVAQDRNELTAVKPDVLIVNAAFNRRSTPDSEPGRFYDDLLHGRTPYAVALRYRTHHWWSPLNLETRFTSIAEDPFSNLSKINPLIEVYRR
jgi:hypothetical protein